MLAKVFAHSVVHVLLMLGSQVVGYVGLMQRQGGSTYQPMKGQTHGHHNPSFVLYVNPYPIGSTGIIGWTHIQSWVYGYVPTVT